MIVIEIVLRLAMIEKSGALNSVSLFTTLTDIRGSGQKMGGQPHHFPKYFLRDLFRESPLCEPRKRTVASIGRVIEQQQRGRDQE